MTSEQLEELGWKFENYWNNRAFYSLSKDSHFTLFEHNGWGMSNPFSKKFELIYCNLKNKEIEKYTELVKSYENIIHHPKDNSLYDYAKIVGKIDNFIKKMKKR